MGGPEVATPRQQQLFLWRAEQPPEGQCSWGGARGGGCENGHDHKSGGDKDKCRYCGIKGHWARECRKKKREEALLARADKEADPDLLLADVVEISATAANFAAMVAVSHPPIAAVENPAMSANWLPRQRFQSRHGSGSEPHKWTCPVIFLNEEKVNVVPAGDDEPRDTVCYLDTGVSNRMTGDLAAFTELDIWIVGTVRFGDRSVVRIEGRGTIAFSIDGATERSMHE